jgi:23S rRNA pseudouridine1911/1915/1917 synthase
MPARPMSEERFLCPDGVCDRADKILSTAYPDVSRSQIKRAIESGKIRREDGNRLDPKSKLVPGDSLIVDLVPLKRKVHSPVALPLSVLFEDEDLIVLDKATGMVVHPGDGTGEDTLVHALLHHCGDFLCSIGSPDRPGIVHRLDKETSGVMVVAKTEKAYHSLVSQFSERKTGKIYQALVAGHPRLSKGEISLPIGRHPKVRVKMAIVEKGGKPAHTEWSTICLYAEKFALLECRIHTGRTHQIRVHFSAINHPLAGDSTYGYKSSKNVGNHFPRVMLHARVLTFLHPQSGDELSFSAPIPPDFQSAVSALSPL